MAHDFGIWSADVSVDDEDYHDCPDVQVSAWWVHSEPFLEEYPDEPAHPAGITISVDDKATGRAYSIVISAQQALEMLSSAVAGLEKDLACERGHGNE